LPKAFESCINSKVPILAGLAVLLTTFWFCQDRRRRARTLIRVCRGRVAGEQPVNPAGATAGAARA
jgi:hypothetical protein